MCKQDVNVEYAQVSLSDNGYITAYNGAGAEMPCTTLDKLVAEGWRFEAVIEMGSPTNWPRMLFKRHRPAYTVGEVDVLPVAVSVAAPALEGAA